MPSMAIARECSIPRSTVYRLLNVMRARDFVVYDRPTRRWSIGPHLFRTAAVAPTVVQVLDVLEAFDSRTPRLSVPEVAVRMGLDLALASELVQVLVAQGLLSYDPSGRVGLGLRIVGLAARVAPIEHLMQIARPHLESLRDRTGETANLLVRDGANALYLDQVESPRSLRVSGWIGRRIPLSGSASGAALTGPGVHTVTDAVEPGVIAIACGIAEIGGVRAAVSITAPVIRLKGSLIAKAEGDVEATANAIASALASNASPGDVRQALGPGEPQDQKAKTR